MIVNLWDDAEGFLVVILDTSLFEKRCRNQTVQSHKMLINTRRKVE